MIIGKSKKVFIVFSIAIILIMFSVSAYATTLISPESGWSRIDDSDSKIIYSGFPEVSFAGNYQGDYRQAISVEDTIHFKFYGTKIRIISPTNYDYASEMTISIDSESYSLSENTPSQYFQSLVFEKQNLSLGIHDVIIYAATTPTVYSMFDAIDIDDNAVTATA